MLLVKMSRICNPCLPGTSSGNLPPSWRAIVGLLGNHRHLNKFSHLTIIKTRFENGETETRLQTPDWNWEQQESTIFGFFGPTTEEVQSIEEQDT